MPASGFTDIFSSMGINGTYGVFCFPQVLKRNEDCKPPLMIPAPCHPGICKPDQLLPLTARLGLPLFFGVPQQQGGPPYKLPEAEDTVENPVLRNLSYDVSPDTQEFQWETLPNKTSPTIMLARADGKDLEMGVVTALYIFIEAMMMEAKHSSKYIGDLNTNTLSVHDKFYSLVTRERFVAFYEQFRTLGDQPGFSGNGWASIECPVKLGCEACSKKGCKLLKCGKCGFVKYCSKECQKADWKAHKKTCTKA